MEYTDKELLEQRIDIYNFISQIYKHTREMYINKDYSYLNIDQDSYNCSLTFGNITIGLWLREDGDSEFGGFDMQDSEPVINIHYIDYKNLDLEKEKSYLLTLFLRLFLEETSLFLHEVVHCFDYINGNIKEGTNSKYELEKDYYNDKHEFHAYLQEYLYTIEESMRINNWTEMSKDEKNALKKEWFEKLKEDRMNKKHFCNKLTKEHYNEIIEHANNLFDEKISIWNLDKKGV